MKSKMELWRSYEPDRAAWSESLKQPHVQRMLDAVEEAGHEAITLTSSQEANAMQAGVLIGFFKAVKLIRTMDDMGDKKVINLPPAWTHAAQSVEKLKAPQPIQGKTRTRKNKGAS